MNPLDQEVLKLKQALEKAGGKVSDIEKAPDFIKRAFVEMIHDCPECREAMRKGEKSCPN